MQLQSGTHICTRCLYIPSSVYMQGPGLQVSRNARLCLAHFFCRLARLRVRVNQISAHICFENQMPSAAVRVILVQMHLPGPEIKRGTSHISGRMCRWFVARNVSFPFGVSREMSSFLGSLTFCASQCCACSSSVAPNPNIRNHYFSNLPAERFYKGNPWGKMPSSITQRLSLMNCVIFIKCNQQDCSFYWTWASTIQWRVLLRFLVHRFISHFVPP